MLYAFASASNISLKNDLYESVSRFISIPVWIQLSTDGNYSWKVFPRQVFACILQHFIDFIHVGCSQLCLLSLDNRHDH